MAMYKVRSNLEQDGDLSDISLYLVNHIRFSCMNVRTNISSYGCVTVEAFNELEHEHYTKSFFPHRTHTLIKNAALRRLF